MAASSTTTFRGHIETLGANGLRLHSPLSSLAEPLTLTGDGRSWQQYVEVAVNTSVSLWSSSTSGHPSTFDAALVHSIPLDGSTAAQDVAIQWMTDEDATYGRHFNSERLSHVHPKLFPSQAAWANLTDFFTGTEDLIDEIQVQNPSTNSATALVGIILVY